MAEGRGRRSSFAAPTTDPNEVLWRIAIMDEEEWSDASSDHEAVEDSDDDYEDEDVEEYLEQLDSEEEESSGTSSSARRGRFPRRGRDADLGSRLTPPRARGRSTSSSRSRSPRQQARQWGRTPPNRVVHDFGGQREVRSRSLQSDATPLQCFMEYFTIELIRFILEMTNMNARQRISAGTGHAWKDIEEEELMAFLGLLIVMGLVRLPSLDSYWQKKEHLLDYPVPNEVMPRDRFREIYRYFQFCDESNAPTPDDPNRDRLYKIRPVLDRLLPRFQSVYSLGQNLSIDESLIPFKGRIRFRQFIPSKRARFGIKVWVLAESETGYVSRIQFYTGRISGAQPDLGLASNVVHQLIAPVTGLYHRLYVDNFYTSPDLFESLLQSGVYACGTIRHTRKGFPKELVIKRNTSKPRGFSDWRTSGPLLAQSWVDNRAVYFLSTMHEPEYSPQYVGPRTVRRKGARGSGQPDDIPCPPLLRDYNLQMGGVDLGDQMRKYYNLTRRCKSWYRRVFSYLLEVSTLNARVVYENVNGKKITGLEFRLQLAKGLIGSFSSSRRPGTQSSVGLSEKRLRTGNHFPKNVGTARNCVVCSKRNNMAPPNKKCTVSRSSITCVECNEHLCVKQNSTCWQAWHTKVYYWK